MGMGIQVPHHLQGLAKEDGWSLFAQQAFANRNPDEFPNLVFIGKKIVNKCQGLPLAVKTLGGLLTSKLNDDDYWEYILNSEIWESTVDNIIPSLRLSYHHLPSQLKRCFVYCSIIPKGHEFVREELVQLWVAEGFVHQKGRKLMEDMAREYFDDLCSRSFFEQSNHNESLFITHNLINELAMSISGEVCFKFEGNKPCTISEKVRHSSCICSNHQHDDSIEQIEAFYKAKSLCTFLLLTWANYLPKQFQLDVFSKFSCLHVLRFRDYSIKELPASIRNLKHLRLLDLSNTQIERLPESICTIYNLLTLLLINCKSLIELCKDLANLINLRHLDSNGCYQLKKISPGICRLTSLQTLPNFVVGENSTPRSGIEELHGLSQVRGSLCISNLKNVVNVQDAMEANLKGKHVSCLELNWSHAQGWDLWNRSCGVKYEDSRDEKNDEDVLDQLQPNPSDLKELYVRSYSGSRFPNWMGAPSFKKLASMRLEKCIKCGLLPPLGQLPVLKELDIDGNDGVKSMGHELYGEGLSVKQFCWLEKLKFCNMSEWEEWSTMVEEGEEEFPRLHELTIKWCPKLKKFLRCFPSLVELIIVDCKELSSLPKHPSSHENLQLDEGGKEFPHLHELYTSNCPRLKELPHLLPRLMSLNISSCGELTALPRLPSIKTLTLKECDKLSLRRVSELTSLSYLWIQSFPNLDRLPEGSLQNLIELEDLIITSCPELVVLQNDDVGFQHLASLRHLEIDSCPKLLYLPPGLHLLTCLVTLDIYYVAKLTSITKTDFQRGQRLQELSIVGCEKLESLPKGLHNLMSLQKLRVDGCPALTSSPEMESFPPSLLHLEIVKCENLLSLPEQSLWNKSLEYLKIEGCSCITSIGGLTRFPTSLKEVEIKDCRDLQSLESFSIKEFSGLVSFPEGLLPSTLTSFEIEKRQNFKSLPKELHKLTYLEVNDCPGLISFPLGLLPSTLISLHIQKCQNLKYLTKGLHNLTSLEVLEFRECKNLESLPEEGLPTMLHELWICDCPLLTQQCQKEKGENWSKISHIYHI